MGQPIANRRQKVSKRRQVKTVTLRRLAASLVAGLIGGALLLAIVLIFDLAGAREWLRARRTPIRSIAVLPLDNLSGDPQQEYFVDGMKRQEFLLGFATFLWWLLGQGGEMFMPMGRGALKGAVMCLLF